ncbi:MAG TPA: tRNA (adenosine(37)-N6)-dimethylallyltransferase MiaA [Bacteroidales bacterium]|nr:tRNA (adenosine(37)-N6)-dimethylallyltransferase MiaA [Bacteroidales bacterium]
MQKSLIVLLGPTGIGKTDLSIDIAKHFKTEIISCDSRQFYKGMSIGTAVPSDLQRAAIKHYFIQEISPSAYYSASLFERDVMALLPQLFESGNIVLMVGGSGMYIDAVCQGIDEIPDVDPEVRLRYLQKYRREGIESIRADLRILDPEHYRKVDLRNYKRILRALEICETTGRPYSSFLNKEKRKRDFIVAKAGLELNRDELYDRINLRVDRMIEAGLEEEARDLLPFREFNALNTVGYKEMFEYFQGKISFEKAVELIKRNSRRYAKRQITWWSGDQGIAWFHPDRSDDIISWIEGKIA